MDIERPPRRTSSTPTTTSELFICFTSRLSHSSSMRLSSKSILSPGHHSTGDKSAAASLSLSSSLSRRLRHNGSLRQSPAMFPSSSKKNNNKGGGSGFENNPEPSSPKVTCIGQVRVKTKKQGKKMKMRACRSSKRLSGGGGEASFRRIEHAHDGLMHQNSQGIQIQNQQQQPDCGLNHRNQRWVHLPLTICEALRAFGSEFSCFLPCKSSCFSSCGGGGGEREKGKEREGSSCGAVFRWLVAVQEGEGEGRERDIELVVEEEEDERERRERMVMGMDMDCSSRRRSIFDDMEFKDEIFDVQNEGKEEAARVSMCIPPKNALLLMRCRSDPAKMSALSHKIWEPSVVQDSDSDEEEDEGEAEVEEEEEERDAKETTSFNEMEEKTEEVIEKREKLEEMGEEIDEICGELVVVEANVEELEMGSEDLPILAEEKEQKLEERQDDEEEQTEEKQSIENREKTENNTLLSSGEEEGKNQSMEDENQPNRCSIDAITIRKMFEEGGKEFEFINNTNDERERVEKVSDISSSSSSSSSSAHESTPQSRDTQQEEENDMELVKSMEKEKQEQELTQERSDPKPAETLKEERESEPKWEAEEREITKKVLPDCLLLMMCEPKLSMEVSKETWVCSTDFIRWLPERHHSKKPTKTDGSDEPKKKRKPPPTFPQPAVHAAVQPARSSISFPAGGVDQKLVKTGVGYEPLVLTRCKSAPMRSTAKIAAPELACSMWGREKMEPHRPATYGVGATGVGF